MRLLAFLIILVCQFSSKAQVVYSFTNCAASGQNGPSQTQVNAAYGSTNSLNGVGHHKFSRNTRIYYFSTQVTTESRRMAQKGVKGDQTYLAKVPACVVTSF